MRLGIHTIFLICFLYGIQCYPHEEQSRGQLFKRAGDGKLPKDQFIEMCKDMVPATGDSNFDEKAIEWFRFCIVTYYDFKTDPKVKEGSAWKPGEGFPDLPDEKLKEKHFETSSLLAEKFFENKRWVNIMKDWKPKKKCIDLLYITAARYIYVTYLLWKASDEAMSQCEVKNKKLVVPDNVCFPKPVGSALCTSDYDVGLIGPKSGEVLAKFNTEFQRKFGYSSEEAFDTNIYGYSLEYSMPYIFEGLTKDFKESIAKMEKNFMYQAQDLVSALFKIRKFNSEQFKDLLEVKIEDEAVSGAIDLWIDFVLKEEERAKVGKKKFDPKNRKDSNEVYADITKKISQGTSGKSDMKAMYLQSVMSALMYAAEAYHARGTMRYVVGHLQMNNAEVKKRLTPLDRLTTIIEDWGDTMKELDHVKDSGINVALVKMSKYLYRTFLPMTELRASSKKNGAKFQDATEIFKVIEKIYEIKKIGGKEIPDDKEDLMKEFFDKLDCNPNPNINLREATFPKECVDKGFEYVKNYYDELVNKMIEWSKDAQ